MAEKVSFLVVSDSGNFVKRVECRPIVLVGLLTTLVLLVGILTLGITDYLRLYRKDYDNSRVEAELALKIRELAHNRKQLQKFAVEINQLKERIVALNQIDRQIRRVAEMDDTDGLFGVGGSAPDDLDADVDLGRKPSQLIREMHRQVRALKHASLYEQESLDELWEVVQERGNFMAYTPTIRPVEGRISSRFGYRESPFTGELEFHHGLDIAGSPETPICATANGRISHAGRSGGYGNVVLIDHGHGLTTLYAHLDQILKKRNAMVKRGDAIGIMGSTGRSTGIHLHYEVRLHGVPVNPEKHFFH